MEQANPRRELRYGLVALILFAPVIDGGTTFVPATVIRLGALALAGLWLGGALGASGAWRRSTPVDLPVVLFFVFAGASAALAAYPYQGLQSFLTLATGALVLAVAAEVARDGRGARWLAGAIAAGGVGQALLALGQWASGAGRAAGTYFNPNHLALALAVTLALLLARRPAGRGARVAGWLAAAVAAAALVASGSRGGVLAALAGAGLVGWLRWRWRAVAGAVVAVLLLVVVPNPLADRLRGAQGRDPLLYSRVQIWQSAVARATDHPLGVGLGMFGLSAQQYAVPVEGELARYGRHAETAHNDYLEVLAELGSPGLALALWTLGVLALRARRLLALPAAGGGGAPDPDLAGSAAALAAMAVQAAVDNPLGVPALVVQGAVLAGIIVAAPLPEAPARPAAPPVPAAFAGDRRPLVRAACLAAILLAALGVVRHGAAYLAGRQAAAARGAGDLAAAHAWLVRAARLAPDSAGYPDALAATALRAWRVSRDPRFALATEEALLEAIRIDPGSATRYARLAEVYREITPADPEGRRVVLLRARTLYEEAERLSPYRVAFPYERAQVLLLLGDVSGAAAALERAAAVEPRFLPARLELARLRAKRGDRDGARAEYAAIEATLAEYEGAQAGRGDSVFARAFLAVDREAVRREAAALKEGRS